MIRIASDKVVKENLVRIGFESIVIKCFHKQFRKYNKNFVSVTNLLIHKCS